MARQRLLGSVRLTLVAALLGALLVASAGVVSAAAAIAPSPGTATATATGSLSFDIPYTTTAFDLDVNCGATSAQCSVYVARNNAAKASDALFTNVTGSRSLIPVTFINDGCFNFRLYDSAHATLLGQINVGHGHLPTHTCNADGTGRAGILIDGGTGIGTGISNGVVPSPPGFTDTLDWDSGFTGGVEDSQVWITESKPSHPITDCTTLTYPNANEVLYAQNVSGEQTVLDPDGGGPYCFALYQGTAHTTRIAGPVSLTLLPYLVYALRGSGTNPNAQGTIYFNTGNGMTRGLVCATSGNFPGPGLINTLPFVYNTEGWNPGGTVASFQTAGFGTVTYTLYTDIFNRNPDGSPTAASCGSGPTVASFTVKS